MFQLRWHDDDNMRWEVDSEYQTRKEADDALRIAESIFPDVDHEVTSA